MGKSIVVGRGDEAEMVQEHMCKSMHSAGTAIWFGFLLNQAEMGAVARRVMEGYETRSQGR